MLYGDWIIAMAALFLLHLFGFIYFRRMGPFLGRMHLIERSTPLWAAALAPLQLAAYFTLLILMDIGVLTHERWYTIASGNLAIFYSYIFFLM